MTQLEPLSLTIPQAVRMSGMSRTAIYAALRERKLFAFKAGKRTLIRFDSLSAFLNSLPPYQPGV